VQRVLGPVELRSHKYRQARVHICTLTVGRRQTASGLPDQGNPDRGRPGLPPTGSPRYQGRRRCRLRRQAICGTWQGAWGRHRGIVQDIVVRIADALIKVDTWQRYATFGSVADTAP